MVVKCPKCEYVRQPEESTPDYECPKCGIIYAKFDPAVEAQRRALAERSRVKLQEEAERKRVAAEDTLRRQALAQVERERFNKMCLTTTNTVPGREIHAVIEVVSAECAFGMNLFKDFFVSITDQLGGRSKSTQSTLRESRRVVMAELRREAFEVGADAVVGVDLDYSEFSGGGKSMLFVVATGTAVTLKPANC